MFCSKKKYLHVQLGVEMALKQSENSLVTKLIWLEIVFMNFVLKLNMFHVLIENVQEDMANGLHGQIVLKLALLPIRNPFKHEFEIVKEKIVIKIAMVEL